MKALSFLRYVSYTGLFLIPYLFHAQEDLEIEVEESAEVFLEAYSDEFQENFFEGLKQKGIQNYDKAVNFLLECKRLEPDNSVISHELAKTFFLDKLYIQSHEYALEAISADPENYWYLNTLVTNTTSQGSSINSVKDQIPWNNEVLQRNLATIYFKNGRLEDALSILNGMRNSDSVKFLEQKINDSISRQKAEKEKNISAIVENSEDNLAIGEMEQFRMGIDGLILTKDFTALLGESGQALENYPSQPYFYYANGLALNKTGAHVEAVEVLEAALDYLIDDIPLVNKIYKALSDAYNALSNPSKANMYLSKIKPGF